jgi:putative ABC transport system permease protein
MNDAALVRKNLFRKPLRTILLVVSIFIAFFIFGVLGSFNYAFYYQDYPTAANRLIVVNKINFTQVLPYAYLNRVRSIEGVVAATPMAWFGGYYQDPRNQIQSFPVEPDSFWEIYKTDFALPPEELDAFMKLRTGMIVGRSFADRFGFKVGDTIPLRSEIYTNKATGQQVWDFQIVGIFDSTVTGNPTNAAYFNYEYFRESQTFGPDFIGWLGVKTLSAEANDQVAKTIDATFANSTAETRTADELAFGRAFLSQLGDIGFIITLVVSAAFAAILMVVGNTMMMAVRERTTEIGVMKTLGFPSGRVVRMVLGESLLLTAIGAGLGLGLAAFLLVGLAPQLRDVVGNISMSPWVTGIGVSIAIVFGIGVGLFPALNAFNLKITDALGRK